MVSSDAGGRRSDLLVNSGPTQTIGVPVGAAPIAYLRTNGPTAFNVAIDANQASGSDTQCGDYNAGCKIPDDGAFSYTVLDNKLTVAAPG
jgi:hypothetical protein